MNKFYLFLAVTIGGHLGWVVGSHIGIFSALIGSGIGSCLGIYMLWKIHNR